MTSFAESAVAGYKLGSEIGTDIASGNILRDVYAGQEPETMSPEMQQGALNKAAVLAKSKGLDSLGYSFSKQANELGKANTQVELDKLKISEAQLSYATQQLPLANSIDDIRTIVNSSVKDTNTKMFIERMLRAPDADQHIPEIKAKLKEAAMTEAETIKAQQLTISGMKAIAEVDNKKADNIRADQNIALKQAEIYTTAQKPIPLEIAKRAGLLPSGEPATEAPVSVRQNNPLNVTDPKTGKIRSFDTPEEGREAGLRDLQSKIAGTSQAYKDKFGNQPVTPERLAETWSPAGAKGNSKESTANYAKAIADAAGIKVNETIENTTQTRDKVFNAMANFEAGAYTPKTTTAPTEGLSLDKPGKAGVSKPSTDTPTSFVGSTGDTYTPKDEREKQLFANVAGPYKEPGVNNIKTNTNVTVAANEMKIGLDNMSILTNKGEKVPSRGAFSNLKTDTFFGAAASAATGPMSNVATQQFEALALPLIRQQATLILGTSASETDRRNLEKSLMTQAFAQSPVLAYQKLAEFAQSARAGLEGQASNPTLNKSQRESLVKSYQAINKAYPYTPEDVFTWQNQVKEGSKQTFGNYVAEKYPVGGGASKTEAGAEGAKPTKPINSFFK